jgi:hypothetical protein
VDSALDGIPGLRAVPDGTDAVREQPIIAFNRRRSPIFPKGTCRGSSSSGPWVTRVRRPLTPSRPFSPAAYSPAPKTGTVYSLDAQRVHLLDLSGSRWRAPRW